MRSGRVHTWTVAHAEVERERTRELARIGANLNQIARWANTFKANADALEVIAHLVAIERALDTLAVESEGDHEPMMVKFLAHGTGPAAAVAAYLLREGPPTRRTRTRTRLRKRSRCCGAILAR